MKKVLGFFSASLLMVGLLGLPNQARTAGQGTLMGNEAGTKFCCASGANDCSAAACKAVLQME